MAGYGQFLRDLLAPLGVYDLRAGTVSGSELDALGTELDSVSQRLAVIERESLTATAEAEGLDRREALFLHRPAAVTAELWFLDTGLALFRVNGRFYLADEFQSERTLSILSGTYTPPAYDDAEAEDTAS